MNRERLIEDAIICSPGLLGYPEALAVRNIRLDTDKRSGRLDVLLLPDSGPHKLVLVECKVSTAPDADGKCLGQLLKYFTFAMRIGYEGIRRLNQYASDCTDAAHADGPTTPRMVLGLKNELDGECRLHTGRCLKPSQIGLFIATDGQPYATLPQICASLAQNFGLYVTIAVVDTTTGTVELISPEQTLGV